MTTRVEQEFGAMPSSIRKEFGNDAMQFLEALGSTDKDVVAKLERLGLKEKSHPVSPVAPVTPTPVAPQVEKASL
ncbi:VP3 [Gokushovirus WZ-2015a]|nr:VP3 [Gokushovirus WZ-2015a]